MDSVSNMGSSNFKACCYPQVPCKVQQNKLMEFNLEMLNQLYKQKNNKDKALAMGLGGSLENKRVKANSTDRYIFPFTP